MSRYSYAERTQDRPYTPQMLAGESDSFRFHVSSQYFSILISTHFLYLDIFVFFLHSAMPACPLGYYSKL